MFKSELSAAGGITVLRNNDKRKLAAQLAKQYPGSGVEALFHGKEASFRSGAVTGAGGKVRVVFRDADPLFFECAPQPGARAVLVPSVYALWACPAVLRPVVVPRSLLPVLWKGAKLMVPGVIRGLEPGTFARGDLRALYAAGDPAHAVGVGVVLCTGEDVARRSGRAMAMLHLYKDCLWALGSRILIPDPPPPSAVSQSDDDDDGDENDGEEDKSAEGATGAENAESGTDCESRESEVSPAVHDEESAPTQTEPISGEESAPKDSPESDVGMETTQDPVESSDENKSEETTAEAAPEVLKSEETEQPKEKSKEEAMDELVKTTLYRALRTSVGKDDLPMLASTFYAAHLLPSRPAGTTIDLKASSFKKLSRLLAAAAAEGVLTVETDGHDNVRLTGVDRAHPLLRAVDTHVLSAADAEAAAHGDGDGEHADRRPLVTELLEVNSHTRFAFPAGTGAVTRQQAVAALTRYIKERGLDAQLGADAKKGVTRVDECITGATRLGLGALHPKRDVLERFVARMRPFYVINRDDLAVSQQRMWGPVPPIVVANEQRKGRRKVTTVAGLEAFCIDLAAFSEELRIRCAASSTVHKSPSGAESFVLVGGTAQKHVVDLLTTKYRVPRKYIKVVA